MEARELFIGGGFLAPADDSQFASENGYLLENSNNANNFTVDELLDFSQHDEVTTDDFVDTATGGHSSTATVVDSCNSSVSGGFDASQFNGNLSCRSFTDAPFSTSELCVPYDELAELEWLSNFAEDSFSSDEVQNLELIFATKTSAAPAITAADSSSSATTISAENGSAPAFPSDAYIPVPGKARSKRSRAAPGNWSSRLPLLPPANSPSDTNIPNNNNGSPGVSAKAANSSRRHSTDTQGRKCLHCASEKTPQWRTGPMGPKTLCNACGVRYKSGRLVPEYRPAASPTFVSTKHSNSHRKVVELRRQKEFQMQHEVQQHQHLLSQASSMFAASNGSDGYLLQHQQRCGPADHFRHMI